MATLIKLLSDALACTCSRTCSFLGTCFRIFFNSIYHIVCSSILLITTCLSSMYKNNVYLRKTTRLKLQQTIASCVFSDREWNRFDIVMVENSEDSFPPHSPALLPMWFAKILCLYKSQKQNWNARWTPWSSSKMCDTTQKSSYQGFGFCFVQYLEILSDKNEKKWLDR